MVIAQAMAAGRPVIASQVGGVAEMVEHGKTGLLVPVGDVDALAGGLRTILKDASVQARMGTAARRAATRRHRAEAVAQATYRVYQEMVARAGS